MSLLAKSQQHTYVQQIRQHQDVDPGRGTPEST